MEKFGIIVAGGNGARMGAPIPKQYLEIGGKPILMHTLEIFFQSDPTICLILVIPESDFTFWDSLCDKFNFQIPHQVVKGGQSRFQSVRNGLDSILSTTGLVAIHDGVRPFVNQSVISRSYEEAVKKGSAIAVINLKDSIRKISGDGKSIFQDRQEFRLVQTPQTFQLDKIKKAFEVPESSQFTDDATVYEQQGWQVNLIDGNLENIKITSPEDMDFAEYLVNRKNKT
jgi:2-C-methyl-D-erythritol 4-phosphate cytidylyltransferase